jgi:septin family protein
MSGAGKSKVSGRVLERSLRINTNPRTYKRQFINTVTGSQLKVGHEIDSETVEVKEAGIPVVKMGDVYIQLVDTPGFGDSRDEDETRVFKCITEWLVAR